MAIWVVGASIALCAVQPSQAVAQAARSGEALFHDDFESGLDRWFFPKGQGHELVDSGDPAHGTVLSLQTQNRIVVALIEGSEDWGNVRLEGFVQFPEDVHNYLGFVYRYDEAPDRTDFGSVYIKGNGSYIRANPHEDMNVGRVLYDEMRTPLEGEAAIVIGEWQRFALEVVGSEAHLYVGDMSRPQFTFPYFEGERGAFGFKPRNPGGAVWVDDLRVTPIDGFSYTGPPIPDIAYDLEGLVTDWHSLGPLTRFHPEVETSPFDAGLRVSDGGESMGWEAFRADPRGAVRTGTVTQYEGDRRVAYFHATVMAEEAGEAALGLSTADDVTLWINGRSLGFITRSNAAWHDFRTNEDRRGVRGSVPLVEGENHILVRVVGGTYATGGFFMSVEPGGR
jgi:hypothetical protein